MTATEISTKPSNLVAEFFEEWRPSWLKTYGGDRNKAQRLEDSFKIEMRDDRDLVSAIADNPGSVGRCLIEVALYGLLLGRRYDHCKLKVIEGHCEFIPEYRGMIYTAKRSGDLDWIREARTIWEGEEFRVEDGRAVHVWWDSKLDRSDSKMIVAAQMEYKIRGCPPDVHYLRRDQIDARRSKARTDKVWAEHYEAMTKKSVYVSFFGSGLVSIEPQIEFRYSQVPALHKSDGSTTETDKEHFDRLNKDPLPETEEEKETREEREAIQAEGVSG